jgi:DNA-binding transcriptional LysR family regulator
MPRCVEIRLLRYVLAVAEELHFSRAAHRERVAQPSLSKQIHDLEERLGTPLFFRTHRHVAVTDAGRVFIKEAKKALWCSERAVESVAELVRPRRESLAIGYSPHSSVMSNSLAKCEQAMLMRSP